MRRHALRRMPTVHLALKHVSHTSIIPLCICAVHVSTCRSGLSAEDAWLGASMVDAAMHWTELLNALHVSCAPTRLTNGLPTTASAAAMRCSCTYRLRDCSRGLQTGDCTRRAIDVTPRSAMPADRAAMSGHYNAQTVSGCLHLWMLMLFVHVSPPQKCPATTGDVHADLH
jgi:hypothetical protein